MYKWLARAQSGNPEWYRDESTAPRSLPGKIDQGIEEAIIASRKKLIRRDTDETNYSFYGAIAIHQELDNLGYKEKPSLSTINRVLKKSGLIVKKNNHVKKASSKRYYPEIKARHPGYLHQLDLITPRYIKGFGVIISTNRIDVYNSQANLEQYQSKGAENIIGFIIDDWKHYGIPRYLQVDNEATFRGSLYHPRTFGKLTRFCLNFGVELVFIPFNEPWRNAHIESFNSRFNELLWQSKVFKNLDQLRSEAKKFRDKHNHYQQYRKNNFGKQRLGSYTMRCLPKQFTFDSSYELPITRGKLNFVRLVEENGTINILNEKFYVEKNLSFEYVWAILNTKEQNLKIYYQSEKNAPKELVKIEPYQLREPVKNRIPAKNFC